jgi:SAM-dependent methyltransferase
MDEAFWDQRYRSAPALWSGAPNSQLVENISTAAPGRALDVGAGEGADALWLAQQGWHVVALDISSVALERGRARADEAGPAVAERITWCHADLTSWRPPPARFDLVSIHFMHLPSVQRVALHARLAAGVAPGGVLLIVGHHPLDLQTTVKRAPNPDVLFTPEDLTAELGENWTVLAAAARPRLAPGRNGEPVTVHDTVLLARRVR